MKVAPGRLIGTESSVYYLYGEDVDSLFEAAEGLLAGGDSSAIRLRVDVSELALVEVESRSQGLFGPSQCFAIIRNAGSASPKQSEQLLKMVATARPENRLIICAPEIDWKKALHKKMQDQQGVVQCEFHMPPPEEFHRWLVREIDTDGLRINEDAMELMGERLYGLRAAARQMIERLRLYDGGRGETIGLAEIGDLLGERSPEDIEAYCHAVAEKDPHALVLLRRLIREQQVAEVQLISWLGTRMNQLLMYSWYQAKRDRNPAQKAKLFGSSRQRVPAEARRWHGRDLARAVKRISDAEKLIKGASVEDNLTVLERMTIELIEGEPAA